MKKMRASVAAASAAAILGAGAFVLPALASPAAASHTLKFISVTKKSITLTKASGAQQDTDVSSTGKTVGFDMLYFNATSASSAALNITLDTKGGFLYGTAKVSFKSGAITGGKVTGGTGAFKGATGTIKATAVSNVREAFTITYRT